MKAQDIYDLQDEMLIDGQDMHALFAELTGDPSPSGRTKIDMDAVAAIAKKRHGDMVRRRKCRASAAQAARDVMERLG